LQADRIGAFYSLIITQVTRPADFRSYDEAPDVPVQHCLREENLHWCEFAAEWLVGSMKNKQAVVASVTVCALVNLAFSDCQAGPVLVDMEAGNGGNVCPIVNRTRKMLS
jgi:hypothetical protein